MTEDSRMAIPEVYDRHSGDVCGYMVYRLASEELGNALRILAQRNKTIFPYMPIFLCKSANSTKYKVLCADLSVKELARSELP